MFRFRGPYYWRRRWGPMDPRPWVRPWGCRPWGCGCFTLILVIAIVLLGVFGVLTGFRF
jgi:hypothetical protein